MVLQYLDIQNIPRTTSGGIAVFSSFQSQSTSLRIEGLKVTRVNKVTYFISIAFFDRIEGYKIESNLKKEETSKIPFILCQTSQNDFQSVDSPIYYLFSSINILNMEKVQFIIFLHCSPFLLVKHIVAKSKKGYILIGFVTFIIKILKEFL